MSNEENVGNFLVFRIWRYPYIDFAKIIGTDGNNSYWLSDGNRSNGLVVSKDQLSSIQADLKKLKLAEAKMEKLKKEIKDKYEYLPLGNTKN